MTLMSTCNVSIRIISRKRVQRQFLAGNCYESPKREREREWERQRERMKERELERE